MKFAIIKTGGKQYNLKEGQTLLIEKLELGEEKKVIFDQVLLIVDGDKIEIGKPLVSGATVLADLLEQGKSKKVLVFKYKSKTRYRVKRGHRQPFTKVKITKIDS